jgi:hypothetical protein
LIKRNKYNAVKREYDGYKFDSTKELNHYLYLKNKQGKGAISALIVHPRFNLFPKDKTGLNETIRAINYTADFQYIENGNTVVVDVKPLDKKTGKYLVTDSAKLRINLFKRKYKEYIFIYI